LPRFGQRSFYWHVNSLKATILINPDSSLLVDETLVIPENDPNFGLRCLIPIGSDDRFDRTYNPGYTDDNGLRVKVQKVTVDGTHCHPERSRSACFAGNSAQSRDLGFAFSVLNQSP